MLSKSNLKWRSLHFQVNCHCFAVCSTLQQRYYQQPSFLASNLKFLQPDGFMPVTDYVQLFWQIENASKLLFKKTDA